MSSSRYTNLWRALMLLIALPLAWALALMPAPASAPSTAPAPAQATAPASAPAAASAPSRQALLDSMKRATMFMVDTVSTQGGFVWSYLPDFSRRWGELEARASMIWIQPPGTPSMGHLFLDAYHATGDEYYYRAAEGVARALMRSQHASGGWNYLHDFAGRESLASWYGTVGRNAWRLEEFQHDWGNATFDDAGTASAAKLLLRMYVEKRDAEIKTALDRALRFVLDSQYPVGAWPQRFPLKSEFSHHGRPDYTSYLTFNDDVAAENLDVLVLAYQALGDARLLDPIVRGMRAFLVTQQPAPQAGWALQYTPDLKPTGARTYEPKALATQATARNVERLIAFYTLTGDKAFLARIPEALDWLDSVKSPSDVAPAGRTHPTFVEIGTNLPLYLHRDGSNVVNGRYYANRDPKKTVGHYGSFRKIDVTALRARYERAKAARVGVVGAVGASLERKPLPRYFTLAESAGTGAEPADAIVAGLNAQGYWPAPLGMTSHPYTRDGSKKVTPGDFSESYVGDETDTSPYRDDKTIGISTAVYIRNMGLLIRALDGS